MLNLDLIIADILKGEKKAFLTKAVDDAKFQTSLYTGLEQGDIITQYRIKESDTQKKQRKRITISRTKHLVHQIENVINLLANLDKPSIDVHHDDPKVAERVKTFIYNNNLDKIAFEFVKYYNLVDANSFIVAGITEDGTDDNVVDFAVYKVGSIHDVKVLNDNLKYVVFKIQRKTKGVAVTDYVVYSEKSVVKLYNKSEYTPQEGIEETEDFYIERFETKTFYCFPIGALKDATNDLKTYVSLLESSSELFRSLIWQGSELDSTKGVQGIYQKFQRATECTNVQRTGDGRMSQCVKGRMTCGNEIIDKCNSCNGTGLSIHTSSQDVIMLPMPKSTDTNVVALSDLVHIEHVQDGFLLFLKNEIKELIDDIMRTVFNSSNLIQADIAKTATEMVIDLQGIYATLNIIGKKVSDAFIWMVDVYCDANNIEGVTTFHGYTFNLKLETIDTLSEKRRKLTESGAPIEVIKSIDMAILQKQNIDNPQAINKYVIWESHKPFNEKSNDQINMILSSLPADNYYKVLYNFFGVIKSKIIDKYSSEFYLFNHEKQKQLIDEEVKTISESIKSELDFTPNFNELQ